MRNPSPARSHPPAGSRLVVAARRLGWPSAVAAVVLVVTLVAGLAAYAVMQERERYRERALASTRNIVTALSNQLASEFDRADLVLRAVAARYRSLQREAPLHPETLNNLLAQHEALHPGLDSLRILDANGVLRHGRALPGGTPTNLSDRDYFQRARDESGAGLIVAGPFVARVSQKWVMVLARRLDGPDGVFAGVVYANIATESFHAPLSALQLGQHGAATIRTAELAMVHRSPDGKTPVGDRKVSAELASIIRAEPAGGDYIAVTAVDGIERANSFRRVPGYPFYVLVGLATTDYLQSWQRYAAQVGVLALLSALLAIFTALAVRAAWHDLSDSLAERTRMAADLEAALAERDKLNAELAERARLAEVANRAKTVFLSNMSHEMRTPLNAIVGFSHLVERQSTDPSIRDRMAKIVRASRHLSGVIEDVLEISRIEAGRLVLQSQPLQLEDVVNDMTAVLSEAAQAGDLNFQVTVDPALVGRTLLGDRKRLAQILINLAGNAIKFTPKGQVRVQLSRSHEDAGRLGLRVLIEDTGIGISADDQARLFQPFQQVDDSSTREHGGTGLGLAISRHLARRMGGDITLTSTPGQGSRFEVTVELSLAPAD